MATYALTTPVADLPYELKQTFAGEFVFLKNRYVAYLLDDNSADPITDIDYPGFHSYAVTSITRVGAVATVTTTPTNSLEVGNTVIIAGAVQAEYNGTFTVASIVTPGSVFTYAVTGTPATPATGTITVNGGFETVPGIVYLNDYIFVGRTDGEIHNCDRSDYDAWEALSFITPEKEPSLLVRLAKSLNYMVAFKQWDTEVFYDAEVPPPGSPLLPQESAYLKLGCADPYSVVEFDGGIVFMSKRDQNQRSREIHMLDGLTPKKISTPEVERILNASDLSDTKALYLSTAGHQLYVLTLRDLEITLVCDLGNGFWGQWTKYTAQSAQDVVSLTREGRVVTAVVVNHGFNDGDPVTMGGASPTTYRGTFNIKFIDSNTFSYEIAFTPSSPATGSITATGYTESYFPAVAYSTYQNLDLVLDETTGVISSLEDDLYEDTGVPINVLLRLPQWDGGNKYRKTFSHIKAVGDLQTSDQVGVENNSIVLVRYSDDDYETWSTYRRQSMAFEAAMVRRLGQARRRAWEFRHTADTALILESADQDVRQGF